MSKVIRTSTNGAIQLTPHFYLSEFTESDKAVRLGIDNTPDPLAAANLHKVATLMERVRKLLGNKGIIVTSGFRSAALNAAVGGSRTSDHLRGEACDFTAPGFGTPLQICKAIASSDIPFGQLIYEGSWVHLSLPDGSARDGEILTARFAGGKPTYTKGLPE